MSQSAPVPLTADTATSAITHMDALPAGTMLGEFELRGLLGVGGFGIVYRGYDHSLQRPVAIKEYLPSALVGRGPGLQVSARSTADAVPFESGLKSFIAEARLLARFDHPSLVKVYRFWEANSTAYMAMPLYQGCTLKEARSLMNGPPPEEWLRTVLWSVLEALKVLHANNTLHRDISPDNIFLQNQGPPVLLDLGAARRAISHEGNRKHTAILKVNYAPIEQYADSEELQEGPWTDLYAIAAVVHGCLRNEPPSPATVRAVKDTLPSFAKLAETTASHFDTPYSAGFVRTIDHALALQPTKRPASVEAFCVEMRLRRPPQIARFDWRVALGDRARPSHGANPQDKLPTQPFVVTQAQTQPGAQKVAAQTVIVPREKKAQTHSRRRSKSENSARASSAAWVPPLLWASVALAFAVVIFMGLSGRNKSAHTPVQVVETPTAAVLPSPVANDMAAPATGASDVAKLPSSPMPTASSAVAVPVVKPASAPKVVKPAPKPSVIQEVAKSEAPAPHESTSKPVHDAKTEQPAPNTKDNAAQGQSGAGNKDLCPGSNFFTRPMCIYQECQKPENARIPACIEDRKRWENREKPP
ncbi:MAG: protein kinase [Rhodoferax sp.]|nr:protein kinase [Rhodoferax sp.]